MKFADYLNQAWADHAKNPQTVVEGFDQGLALIQEPNELSSFLRLVVHVLAEHLGEWELGLEWMSKFSEHEHSKDKSVLSSLKKSEAIFKLCRGDDEKECLAQLSDLDQIESYVKASAALVENKKTHQAQIFYEKGLQLVSRGLSSSSEVNKVLAISSNNICASLEDKSQLNREEIKFMIFAAKAARKYWEVAGGWQEVERAEYRLASANLKAEDYDSAMNHAEKCYRICKENEAEVLEFFYAFEIMAKIHKAIGNQVEYKKNLNACEKYFQQLSAEQKGWSQDSLEKLR
jgi:tetratricopeptide (TPR) repeat protein